MRSVAAGGEEGGQVRGIEPNPTAALLRRGDRRFAARFVENGTPMTGRETVGWVFRAYEDEGLLQHLKEGRVYLWKGAHSAGKERGQPVLFLQSTPRSQYWVGRGHVVGTEERWRKYGVRVACDRLLHEGLPALGPPGEFHPEVRPPGYGGATDPVTWENLALADALGVPFLSGRRRPDQVYGRDFRLAESDLGRLLAIQPRLADLWPE